jgi:hypothetical protein
MDESSAIIFGVVPITANTDSSSKNLFARLDPTTAKYLYEKSLHRQLSKSHDERNDILSLENRNHEMDHGWSLQAVVPSSFCQSTIEFLPLAITFTIRDKCHEQKDRNTNNGLPNAQQSVTDARHDSTTKTIYVSYNGGDYVPSTKSLAVHHNGISSKCTLSLLLLFIHETQSISGVYDRISEFLSLPLNYFVVC